MINAYASANGSVQKAVPYRRQQRVGPTNGHGPTLSETRDLVFQKLSISEIAQRRGLTENTIVNHIQGLVMAGEELELDHLMPPPDRLARIESGFQQTGDQKLAPVQELLGEDYSYEELALARIGLRQRDLLS